MRKHWGIAGLVAATLLGGCQGHNKAESPIEAVPKTTVMVEKVRRQPLARVVEIPADVQAWQEAKLYAKVAGYLKDIKVDKGDHVTKGELLATIESPETGQEAAMAAESFNASRAALSQIDAQVSRARAQRDQMVAEIHAANARELQANAAVLRAQGDLGLARQTYQRLKKVYDKDSGLIARQDVDVAEAQMHDAEARLLAAKDNVIAAHQSVLEAASKKDAADREILALQAQTAQGNYQSEASADAARKAQTMLDYTEIRAPFTGLITARYLDPGALVQNSASNAQQAERPVLSEADFDVVRIYVDVPQADLPYVHSHTAASIVADELPGKVLRGHITRLSGGLDPATRTMLTEIDLPNHNHQLHPGQLVRVRLSLAQHPDALTVPLSAVAGEGAYRSVFVYRDGRVHKTAIQVGIETPDRIEVTQGVKEGDEVVSSGVSDLTDGAEVATATAPPVR